MEVIVLSNNSGMRVELSNLGAMILAIYVPDRKGKGVDVTVGYSDMAKYMHDGAYLGKSIGRYGNRIARGRFTLEGVEYRLATNNGPNHLHGGDEGFDSKLWSYDKPTDASVRFRYESPDGEEGYPARCRVEALYELSDDNRLTITYSGDSDATTVMNLTNHTYFNLNGRGSILEHDLKLYCSYYLPTDATLIPTGEIASVEGTPMDFRTAKPIGRDIDADFEPLKIGNGYDHCWSVDGDEHYMRDVAELYSPLSGIVLSLRSTQPGVQIYTGNFLDGMGVAKWGAELRKNEGVAIECQNFPDAPNQAHFPSPILRAGEKYFEQIELKFDKKC